MAVWNRSSAGDGRLSPKQYLTYRDENRVFEDIGVFRSVAAASVTGLAEPEQVLARGVTGSLLSLLRVQPVIGRRFAEEDDSWGAPQTIMLSYAYWQRQFGANPGVVGSTLRVDATPREVIGVLPRAFTLPGPDAAIYRPLQLNRAPVMEQFDRNADAVPNVAAYQAIARLSPDTTIEQAHADLERLFPTAMVSGGITLSIIEEYQARPNLRPLKQDYVGDIGNVLWLLLGTVGIVLLIACANVANLFLVRAEGRQQEVAVRTALAARGRRGDS